MVEDNWAIDHISSFLPFFARKTELVQRKAEIWEISDLDRSNCQPGFIRLACGHEASR